MTDYGVDDAFGPRVSSYPLHCAEGREAFLYRIAEIADPCFMEATNHIWNLLIAPKSYRCAKLAAAGGVGGVGKGAILNLLRKFIEEILGGFTLTTHWEFPMPARSKFGCSEDWHAAVMASWAQDRDQEYETIKKYSAILNGEPAPVPHQPARVLVGPWSMLPSKTGHIF